MIFGAPGDEGRAYHADPHSEEPGGDVEFGLFLVEDRLLQRGATPPTKLLRPGDAGPASFVQGELPLLARRHMARVRLGIAVVAVALPGDRGALRPSVLGQPGIRLRPEYRFFWGVVKIHGYNLGRRASAGSNRVARSVLSIFPATVRGRAATTSTCSGQA